MTKLSQLKIDPEFQNQINPPSFEETHQLEMNVLKEERVLNPIITWNGYIVDGHAPCTSLCGAVADHAFREPRTASLGRCRHGKEFPCRVHCKRSNGAGSACADDELYSNPEQVEQQLFRAK